MVSLPLNYNLHPPFLPSVQMFCPQLCKHLLAKVSGASYLNFIRLFSHIENGGNNSTIGPPQSCCEMKETIHAVCLAQCLICCYILISPPHSPTLPNFYDPWLSQPSLHSLSYNGTWCFACISFESSTTLQAPKQKQNLLPPHRPLQSPCNVLTF